MTADSLSCSCSRRHPTRRFFAHQDAVASLRYVSGTKLDERIIRCDLDPGYTENRQYGRGRSGGQVRDEYREDWDGQSFRNSLGCAWKYHPTTLSNPLDLSPRSLDADVRPPPSIREIVVRSRSRRLGSPQEPGRDGSATATRSRRHVPIRSRREWCRARSPDRSGNARRGELFPGLLARHRLEGADRMDSRAPIPWRTSSQESH